VAPLAARPALLPTRAARPLPPQARAAEESAAALFGAATEARRRGDGQAAVLHFARLSRAFPGSREELTGRVLAARLLLDRLGRPADAEALYARYLADAADGPLAEEARVGRALACGALGRQEDERRAWQELLARHPASVHRARALAALQRLERGR
jgi:tetratricopeptide (TPR) repeat protein